MNNYILIQNDGEIETGAFELIGASTKREQSGKIGFFGSGLKYSIAFMMRSGIDFRIFSGLQELKFTLQTETLRGQPFERICINGTPTSYTTTMGPTWKETWFVLREIYCNALDEPGCQLIKETENINPSEGKTRIYIELVTDLKRVVNNWDAYFAIDREPVFGSSNIYTSYLGSNDIQGRIEYFNNQGVKVYRKTDGVVYRRGVRVYHNPRLMFDYDFECIDINEDRTAKNTGALEYAYSDMAGQFVNENWLTTILRTGTQDMPCREYTGLESSKPNSSVSDQWIAYSRKYLLVVKSISGKYLEQIQRSSREVLLMPNILAKAVKEYWPEAEILGLDKNVDGICMSEVDTTPKMDFLLKEVMSSLRGMNYAVVHPVSIVEFQDDTILGHADVKQKHIFLSRRVFDMGRREIAATLIEETEHIASGYSDETRAFQTHLISSWLTTMENSNGLFL